MNRPPSGRASTVAVVGAGAVGAGLGALLALAGHEVTLVARPGQLAALRAGGIRLDGCLGERGVRVAAVERLTSRPDLALVAVKTQDVVGAARAQRDALSGATVVACQNGIRGEELLSAELPASTVLSAAIALSATCATPGRVTVAHCGGLVLGRALGPGGGCAAEAARVLGDAVPTRLSADIRGALWLKLVLNLNNALSAVTGLPMGEVYADRWLGTLGVRLMREGLRVARRMGVRLEPLYDVPAGPARMFGSLPVGLARWVLLRSGRRLTRWPVYPSTLQSVWRGRPTEIDYLNGEIVRLGRGAGVPTPLNERAVELVGRVQERGAFLDPVQVRRAW